MDRKKYDLSLDRKKNQEDAPFEISAIGERRYDIFNVRTRHTPHTATYLSPCWPLSASVDRSDEIYLWITRITTYIYLLTVRRELSVDRKKNDTGLALAFCQFLLAPIASLWHGSPSSPKTYSSTVAGRIAFPTFPSTSTRRRG